FGEIRPVRTALDLALAAEASEPLAHVGGIADLALLTVIDDVDAGGRLLTHDVARGALNARRERRGVDRCTCVHRLEHAEQLRRPRQAPRVGGEDAVRAAFHASSNG